MKKEELFKRLHDILAGKPGKRSTIMSIFDNEDPQTGFANANRYYQIASKLHDAALTELGRTLHYADMLVFDVLVTVFTKWMGNVNFEFPDLPPLSEIYVDINQTAPHFDMIEKRIVVLEKWLEQVPEPDET